MMADAIKQLGYEMKIENCCLKITEYGCRLKSVDGRRIGEFATENEAVEVARELAASQLKTGDE